MFVVYVPHSHTTKFSLLNSHSTIFFLFILNKLTFFAVFSYEVATLTETEGKKRGENTQILNKSFFFLTRAKIYSIIYSKHEFTNFTQSLNTAILIDDVMKIF
ncbi:hypothetical protein ACKWTF_009303 [Chironomus riparius]